MIVSEAYSYKQIVDIVLVKSASLKVIFAKRTQYVESNECNANVGHKVILRHKNSTDVHVSVDYAQELM